MTQLPEAFVEYISRFPALAGLKDSLLEPPVTSIRLNPQKCQETPSSVASIVSGSVAWCDNGLYLSQRPQFTFDPCLHQGAYYVQDASSMAVSAVIRQISGDSPLAYLDMCAAPGGKTSCAVSALPAGSVVVANEYDHKRASILYENMAKWGVADIVVSRGDTSRLARLGQIFDIVAVDAPCSGEGMMRKDIQAVEQWSPRLVDSCASLQKEIVDNALACLKPGGYLIYSTCTFNIAENEDNVRWMQEKYGLIPVRIDRLEEIPGIAKGIDCSFPCYRFLPGKVEGEGLFIAVLKKTDSDRGHAPSVMKCRKTDKTGCKEASEWVLPDFELWTVNNEIYAASRGNADSIRQVSSQLDTLTQGVHVATIKGKDIVPTHEFALSAAVDRSAFPNVEVTLNQAIQFLQKENISLPPETPRGYVLITYLTVPLGFVKNIGNRSNNLLPKQWRILSHR